ncbi:HvfC/BufC N-terminal domain-containing protein [Paraburkholderia heleia]|uniref:HvfC/BufC N-terminal domain-containing protein n=1 Tax=Paraburkholderia heleia TaxID=634127 RepID=UPI0005A700A8|nr:DNA-binding domain-containing protein [Paraburkholderia heleia]
MKLAEWQQHLQTWLVRGSEDAARRLDDPAAPGLAVYQNNYRSQLVDCLQQSFVQVREWMGDEAFLQAALTHIDRHPPHAWTLDAYPHEFGETLASLYPDNPDLHELAWIERALDEAFVARDASCVPDSTLAAIDWGSASLQFTPSLRVRAATTNADDIWTALCHGASPPGGEMLAEPGGLLVWRRGLTSSLKRVDAIEYEALLHVLRNRSFASLCDRLAARLGEADGIARAGTLLATWFASELITGVEHSQLDV